MGIHDLHILVQLQEIDRPIFFLQKSLFYVLLFGSIEQIPVC